MYIFSHQSSFWLKLYFSQRELFFNLSLFCNCSRRSEQQATGLRAASVGAKRVPLGLSTSRALHALTASQLWSVAGGHPARLEMKSQPLAGKPAGSAPLFQDAQNFNHISSERSRDLPCCQRCTTGIRYPRLLLPHHLLPWSEGR